MGLLPVFVPVALCLFAAAQRAVDAALPGPTFGQLSSRTARRTAQSLCSRITGESTRVRETSRQEAVSARDQSIIREWTVLCDAAAGRQYLVRINADTGQVFGVNQVAPEPGTSASSVTSASKQEAEREALRYVRLLGVSADSLRATRKTRAEVNGRNVWNFNYRFPVSKTVSRMLAVSVDGQNGSLVYVWNPAYAM